MLGIYTMCCVHSGCEDTPTWRWNKTRNTSWFWIFDIKIVSRLQPKGERTFWRVSKFIQQTNWVCAFHYVDDCRYLMLDHKTCYTKCLCLMLSIQRDAVIRSPVFYWAFSSVSLHVLLHYVVHEPVHLHVYQCLHHSRPQHLINCLLSSWSGTNHPDTRLHLLHPACPLVFTSHCLLLWTIVFLGDFHFSFLYIIPPHRTTTLTADHSVVCKLHGPWAPVETRSQTLMGGTHSYKHSHLETI